MSNITITPYMSLSLPIVGVEIGPAWASEVNAAFAIVDAHTHIQGQGLPIPTAGINVNADFGFNGYNAINFRSVRLASQSGALALSSDLLCLYATGGNLYYNDGSGNQIQITAAGNVNTSSSGNITGMGGTTATATYTNATSTFAFNSATNTPAKFSVGPLTIGRNSVSPKTVTLIANGAASASYTWTFPTALPSTTGYVQVDTTGAMSIQGVVVPGTSNGLVSLNGVPGSTAGSAIGAGYLGEAIFGPSNKNTGAFTAFSSSGNWQNFQSISLTAGVWLVYVGFQVQATDNSTTFTTSSSIDFQIGTSSGSNSAVYGGFAPMDYNSIFYSNANNNPGYIASGSIAVVLIPGSTTSYYLNANATYTGSAPKGRGGMTAVRIG